MKKIIFIADLFREHFLGGGECNDAVLIDYLESKGHVVEKIPCQHVTKSILNSNNFFIVGNFVQLAAAHMASLQDKSYIIYEHDHKYLATRDPSPFKDFLAPPEMVLHREFYAKAKAVVVLSTLCKGIIEKTLQIDNVHNIGCSLWSDEKLSFIESLVDTPKTKEYAIIASPNPVKGFIAAKNYCDLNGLPYNIIQPCAEKELLTQLAQHKMFVFFPHVLETFCRLVAEAKMLNCGVLTKAALLGFYSEDCRALNGHGLITEMSRRKRSALELFHSLV